MISSYEKESFFGIHIINFGSTLIVPCLTSAFFPSQAFLQIKTISHAPSFFSHPRLTVSWFSSIQRLTHRRFLGTESNKVWIRKSHSTMPSNPQPPTLNKNFLSRSLCFLNGELTQLNIVCRQNERNLSFFGNIDQSFLFFFFLLIILSHQRGWIILSILVN